MSTARRTFTMTDPAVAQKQFEARRAGLAPADDDADQAFIVLLRVLEPAQPRQQWHHRKVRALTDDEQRQYLAGQPIAHGEIVREDVWGARVAAKTAVDRAQSVRRAARAAGEAKRLAAEARRFDDDP
jgi:hypothetical protein